MRVLFALIAAAGCGRIGFTPSEDAPGADAVQMPDTPAVDAMACAGFGPWQSPVKLAGINTDANTEWAPSLSADQLTLVFSSNQGTNGYDIYMATRAATSDPFGTAVEQTNLVSPAIETDPTMTPDGLTLYFTSSRLGGPYLYRAKRADTSASWDAPVIVPELSTTVVFGPGLTPDGSELFFQDNTTHIVRATVSGDSITVVGQVLELGADVGFTTFTVDGLTVFFEKMVVFGTDDDLYVSTRPAIGQPFASPTVVTELQSPMLDDDPELSRDGMKLYFASDRGGPSTDIYEVDRSCQ